MTMLLRTSSLAVLALCVAGCATEPPGALIATDVPAGYEQPVAKDAPLWPKAEWWKGFGSEEMNSLIAKAQTDNLDVATAAAQVLQAEGQAGISSAALFPSLSLSDTASRSGKKSGPGLNSFGLSLQTSYEADFWGQVRDTARAGDESFKAAVFNREVVGLTTTASVANTYLAVLALRQRTAIAQQNIDAANRILAITQAKVTNGVSSQLDLAQQEALVNGQKAQVPALQESGNEQRFALAVLLGRPPEGFDVKADRLDGIEVPQVQPGLPSQLLERRPDVAKAEAQLASAHANVDAARAAFFPQINLTSSGGYASAAIGSLINPSSLGYSIGGSLLQTIFDGGRLSSNLELTKAEQTQLVLAYRSAVLNAFKDVETALSQASHYAEQERYNIAQVKAASEAFRISEIQYREGVADLLTVLNAQQTLFSAEDTLVQVKLARIEADIGLYKALGGGWSEDAALKTQPPAPPPGQKPRTDDSVIDDIFG